MCGRENCRIVADVPGNIPGFPETFYHKMGKRNKSAQEQAYESGRKPGKKLKTAASQSEEAVFPVDFNFFCRPKGAINAAGPLPCYFNFSPFAGGFLYPRVIFYPPVAGFPPCRKNPSAGLRRRSSNEGRPAFIPQEGVFRLDCGGIFLRCLYTHNHAAWGARVQGSPHAPAVLKLPGGGMMLP